MSTTHPITLAEDMLTRLVSAFNEDWTLDRMLDLLAEYQQRWPVREREEA